MNQCKPDFIAGDKVPKPGDGNEYEVCFWRRSQYSSFEDAKSCGGIYFGETLYGYTSYADAMTCVRGACICMDATADDDLVVRLTVDGNLIGDLSIGDCL